METCFRWKSRSIDGESPNDSFTNPTTDVNVLIMKLIACYPRKNHKKKRRFGTPDPDGDSFVWDATPLAESPSRMNTTTTEEGIH